MPGLVFGELMLFPDSIHTSLSSTAEGNTVDEERKVDRSMSIV